MCGFISVTLQRSAVASTMRVSFALFAFTYIIVTVTGCEPDQYHNGCMIQGNTCKCGYGCKTDYIYKTRRACRNALKVQERTPSAGYGGSYGSAGNSGSYGNTGYSGSNGNAGYSGNYGGGGYGGGSNGGAGYGTNYGAGYSTGYGAAFERTLGLTQPIAMTPSPPRSSDICSNMPCSRGICIQTANEPGFACKCEGTGFYGQRCEKACPTMPMRGMVFPHECVVI